MRLRASLASTFAVVLSLAPAAQAGLTIAVVSEPTATGNDHPQWKGSTDSTGNTSVSNDGDDLIRHSSLGGDSSSGHFLTPGLASSEVAYFQRDRDLGQTFKYNGTTGRRLDRITVKTGPGTNVVRAGMYGQYVSLQVFKVSGTCAINNNGSTTTGKHGFPHGPPSSIAANRDDYCEGETYTSLGLASGGVFPTASAFGCGSTTPDPSDACLKGKFLRFDLTGSDEVSLVNGESYAFVLMVDGEGAERGFTIANAYSGTYADGHGIRREGNGTFPPTTADPTKLITDPANAAARIAGDLDAWALRTARAPGTNGYPDVDTHRDVWFVVESAPGGTLITEAATNTGWGRRDQATTVQTGALNVRSDGASNANQRKAWMRFDLSNDGINWTAATTVRLELTTAEQPSTASCGRTLTVYALPATTTWPTAGVSWSSGPSNYTTSAWAFTGAVAVGTYPLPCQEALGSIFTVNLDLSPFKADADKVFVLGLSFGRDTVGSSYKVYESGTHAPRIKVTY